MYGPHLTNGKAHVMPSVPGALLALADATLHALLECVFVFSPLLLLEGKCAAHMLHAVDVKSTNPCTLNDTDLEIAPQDKDRT
jgi:hypothetical protein